MNESTLGKLEVSLERRIYKESFYEFCKTAFCQLHPGLEYDDNWHVEYICKILQGETERVLRNERREKDIIINISPRSMKSMIASVIWPVWSWTIDPSLKFLTCSYSDQIASILSRLSRDLIGTTWFQRLYGTKVELRSDLSGAGHYGTTATGYRYAFGMDGTVTGIGGDFLLLDDPQNPKKANSEVERDNAIDRYNQTISNRLNKLDIGGRIIIQQRLHEMDLTGYLMDPKHGRPEEHLHINIPADYDEKMISPPEIKQYYKDGLFWPSKFPRFVLDKEKKKGSLYYAGQFQQRPVPLEGNIFKRLWFDIVQPESIQRDVGNNPIHFYVDTAYTEDNIENDPSGILSCFEKDNFIYIVNFIEVWKEFPDFCKFLGDYCSTNGYNSYSRIKVEPKASGKSVVQQMRAYTKLNVSEIVGDFLRDDKVQRATSVSGIAEAKRVRIVDGPWVDEFLNYICSFPKAAHDEAVDTLVYALNDLIPINEFTSAYV